MRIPEDGTFGDTFFEARLRAIVAASFLNNPSCGYVDSVCTLADHFLRPCELRWEVLRVRLLLLLNLAFLDVVFLDVLLAHANAALTLAQPVVPEAPVGVVNELVEQPSRSATSGTFNNRSTALLADP